MECLLFSGTVRHTSEWSNPERNANYLYRAAHASSERLVRYSHGDSRCLQRRNSDGFYHGSGNYRFCYTQHCAHAPQLQRSVHRHRRKRSRNRRGYLEPHSVRDLVFPCMWLGVGFKSHHLHGTGIDACERFGCPYGNLGHGQQ